MRIAIVCSSKDTASANMAEWMIKENGFDEKERGTFVLEKEDITLYRIDELPWTYDVADSLGADLVVFLSQHASSEGIPALTAHSLGNWNDENKFGGRPNMLAAAAPVPMLSALKHLGKIDGGIRETYEATHHGPFLNTPCFFMEMGGSSETVADKELARRVAGSAFETVLEIADDGVEYSKIAIGIGGGHYPAKFSALASGRGYAFSYIMPKYGLRRSDGSANLSMLEQAIEKTKDLELAVIEWKGVDAVTRNGVISMLDEKGVEYERA